MTPDWLRAFVEALEASGIPYAISGGIASSIFGEPRLTQDVDVVVDVTSSGIPKLIAAFPAARFYLPPQDVIRIEARRETGGHVNVIDEETGGKADLYFAGADPLNALSLRMRVRRSLGDLDLWLAPPECVIVRKLEWFREGASSRQLRDVRAMLAGGEELDHALLERLIEERGLGRWWREAQE